MLKPRRNLIASMVETNSLAKAASTAVLRAPGDQREQLALQCAGDVPGAAGGGVDPAAAAGAAGTGSADQLWGSEALAGPADRSGPAGVGVRGDAGVFAAYPCDVY